MDTRFPGDVDQAIAAELVRSGMADVEVTEDFLTAVIVADDFATAVAAILGRPDTMTAGIDSGGKSAPPRATAA